jgi:hypothetical protein
LCSEFIERALRRSRSIGRRNAVASAARIAALTGLLAAPFICIAAPPSSALASTISASAEDQGPANIVIAVDESGSITLPEMEQERQAARLIALGELDPGSKVAVIGFAGLDAADHDNQQAFDQICPLTEVNTSASRQALSDCIGQLHVRTKAQGWNTDFISVIDQGVADLKQAGDPGRPRLIFLLTDGVLDVYGSPAFSGTRAQVAQAAQNDLVDQALPNAMKENVEIWPLGFGAADESELATIASGGAQGHCSALADASPSAHTVATAAEAETALIVDFAHARCLNPNVEPPQPVGPSSLTLHVKIPIVATTSVIEVLRQNPAISVSYFDPKGRQVPTAGSFDGSSFQLSGANGPVEALRVTDPLAGTWSITLKAPPSLANTLVRAVVLWQGILQSNVLVNPPAPKAGQRVVVSVQLELRDHAIADPQALRGVTVSVSVKSQSFAAQQPVQLTDDGQRPDAKAGDGIYSGYLTIPATATGQLTFAAIVTGQGVLGDHQAYTTSVSHVTSALSFQLAFGTQTAAPGSTVTGSLQVNNEAAVGRRIHLVLVGTAPGVTITPSSMTISSASGTTVRAVTVHFASSVPTGPVVGTIKVIGPTPSGPVYLQTFMPITLQLPKPWPVRFWWALALAVLAIAAAIWLLIASVRSGRSRISMADVDLVLYDRSGQRVQTIQPPVDCGSEFRFTVDPSPGRPRLDLGSPDEVCHIARRRGSALVVETPEGESVEIQPEGRGEIGGSLSLGFIDHRLDMSPLETELTDEEEAYDGDHGRFPWGRRRRGKESEPANLSVGQD